MALSMQDCFLRSKSRVRRLSEGDRNTSFLHNMIKVVSHFKAVFSKDNSIVNSGLVEKVIPSMVTAAENSLLIAMPSSDEISATVNQWMVSLLLVQMALAESFFTVTGMLFLLMSSQPFRVFSRVASSLLTSIQTC
ncbi:hypothetical protein M0R45_007350 [Rubus argutus]|uniref:Uncharacterized protein n=1 Tax=Rubus argutus TaxID=59490 RepID=A0AAW1Y011_RUBAR